MRRGCNWTADEYQYLEENWGHISLKSISTKLNRSVNSIKIKVARLGLGAFLDNGDYVTYNQLLLAIGKASYSYTEKSWIEERGFPVKYRVVNNCRFRIVFIEDFWKWADKHRNFIDWSKFVPLALGKEPDWVKYQRKICYETKSSFRTTPWTTEEDNRLIMLLKQHRHTVDQISKRLGRTTGAIQRRCTDLGIKERPVKADNHKKWSDEEYHQLGEMIKQGYSYELLAEHFNRSSKAIRGRVYWMYLTENLDKVRAIIGDGSWGDNRPLRSIKHNTLNTAERIEVKENISQLAGILRGMAKLRYDYEDFWQKDTCKHWTSYCTKGEINCDECEYYQRIKEQYCKRCGGTFFERKENDLCESCRVARKKQAQKKYAILQKRGA